MAIEPTNLGEGSRITTMNRTDLFSESREKVVDEESSKSFGLEPMGKAYLCPAVEFF